MKDEEKVLLAIVLILIARGFLKATDKNDREKIAKALKRAGVPPRDPKQARIW